VRVALLANPESGGGGASQAGRLLEAHGAEVEIFGLDDAAAAVGSEPERIVVAGGDGSIGCAAEAAHRVQVPLAVLPVGTANDFARALNLPRDPDKAAALAVEGRKTRRLDLAFADGRPFVNAASAGLSPVAARKAHGLKRALGPLSYGLGALRAGMRADPVECEVRGDGEDLFTGRAWQVTVALTGAFGGGAEVAADPRDGRLDIVVIEAGSRARLVVHAYGLRAGRVEAQTGVIAGRATRVEVVTDGETGFNVDGELLDAPRLSFGIVPQAYEVITGR
jgi:YegS/Rv2252/BmrU family lipid kinase